MGEKHYYEQKEHTISYLIPYFQKHIPSFKANNILEIGCAEAGFLSVLHQSGIKAKGVEIEAQRVETANNKNPNIKIYIGDITDEGIVDQIGDTFDLIVMRDTIEHIHDRMAAFSNISKLLKKNGYLYITFPPKYSGFSGHQQNGKSILRFVPYLHFLPDFIIRFLGKIFKEKNILIERVILNYKDGLSIRAFENYYSKFNLIPVVKELYIFRPIYKIRFKVSPIKVPNIPLVREFIAFGCEYLLQVKD